VHRVAEMLTRHGSPQWRSNPITVRRFAGPATDSVIKSLYREGQTHVVVRAFPPPVLPWTCSTPPHHPAYLNHTPLSVCLSVSRSVHGPSTRKPRARVRFLRAHLCARSH